MMLIEHKDPRDANAELQSAVAVYLGDSDDSKVKKTISCL